MQFLERKIYFNKYQTARSFLGVNLSHFNVPKPMNVKKRETFRLKTSWNQTIFQEIDQVGYIVICIFQILPIFHYGWSDLAEMCDLPCKKLPWRHNTGNQWWETD